MAVSLLVPVCPRLLYVEKMVAGQHNYRGAGNFDPNGMGPGFVIALQIGIRTWNGHEARDPMCEILIEGRWRVWVPSHIRALQFYKNALAAWEEVGDLILCEFLASPRFQR